MTQFREQSSKNGLKNDESDYNDHRNHILHRFVIDEGNEMNHNETLNRINDLRQSQDILDQNLNTEEFEARAASILLNALPEHVYRDMERISSDK